MRARTLAQPTRLTGKGLFSAQPISLLVSPSEQPGIRFIHQNQTINAHIDQLSNIPVHPAFERMSPRCTSIRPADQQRSINIATIEHLMSALSGLHITNAIIEIQCDSPSAEIPILDGSSIDFTRAFTSAGIVYTNQPIEPLIITKTIRVESGDSSITIEPSELLSYSYTIEYDHPSIINTTVHWNNNPQEYIDRIAHARTFCLEHEANAMQASGLFSHLTPKDMLVLSDIGPLENAFRDPHEPAHHKLLDLIGDLALVGQPMIAKISAHKSGHALAHQAARALVDQFS